MLERSCSDLELILRPFLINMEHKTKGIGWIFEKNFKNTVFFNGFWRSRVSIWIILGAFLESSWASWGGPKAAWGGPGDFLMQSEANLKQSRGALDEL